VIEEMAEAEDYARAEYVGVEVEYGAGTYMEGGKR
jgi:hypothetical protein